MHTVATELLMDRCPAVGDIIVKGETQWKVAEVNRQRATGRQLQAPARWWVVLEPLMQKEGTPEQQPPLDVASVERAAAMDFSL